MMTMISAIHLMMNRKGSKVCQKIIRNKLISQ